MTTGAEIVTEARRHVGVRWRHQGRNLALSVDCIGYVGGVGVALGVPGAAEWLADARFTGYGRQPNSDMIYQACAEYLTPVTPKGAARLGDILLMRFEAEPQHFAILSALDPPYMLHAYAQTRRVVENRIDERWAARIVCAYRFRGVTA